MTQEEVDAATASEYQPVFHTPACLVLLAGKDEHEGYGHYSRREVFHDPTDNTYVGVEGSGCSCDGADTAWVEATLKQALARFSEYNRDELETELKEKGLL